MRGTPSTRATVLTLKLVCIGVCLKRLFSTTLALASRLSSITRRALRPAESFCTRLIPSRSPAFTRSAIFFSTTSTEVWYGNSVTTMRVVPRDFLDLGHGPHLDRPLPGAVRVENPLAAEDRGPGGEVRALHDGMRSSGVASVFSRTRWWRR